jgi:hypothetical protein
MMRTAGILLSLGAIMVSLSSCLFLNSGSGDLSFSGYQWSVKSAGDSPIAPGPNYFSDQPENVYLDGEGHLHLAITKRDGRWHTAEVILDRSLGYGRYVFKTVGRIDQLDPQAVLGLFTWDPDASEVDYREIDIEFSRWGDPDKPYNGQYVIQERVDEKHTFAFSLTGDQTTHVIDWRENSLTFTSYHGHGTDGTQFATHHYSSPPPPGDARVRMNLWLVSGNDPDTPASSENLQVEITDFSFTPY